MSATVTHSAEVRTQIRARILQILLSEQAISDGLLGRLDDPHLLCDPQLLDESAELKQAVRTLPVDDLCDVLRALPSDRRLALWSLPETARRAKILALCDPCLWPELTATLSDKTLLQMLQTLPLEQQILLSRRLPRPLTGRLLTLMEADQRNRARTLLQYDLNSIGAQMTPNTPHTTVHQDMALLLLLQWLRQQPALPDAYDRLFVTDNHGQLCGELPLTLLLASTPDGRVRDIMQPPQRQVHPDDDALEVATLLRHEKWGCLPVTNEKGILLGQFSLIQATRLLQTQQDQRLFRLAGLRREEDLFAPITQSLSDRAIPLVGIAILSLPIALLSAHFSSLLGQWPMLALMLPLLMVLCATGTWHSAAIAQHALDQQSLLQANAAPVIIRELGVALLAGLGIGSLLGLTGGLYYQDAQLGSLVVLITVTAMMISALLGIQIPRLSARQGRTASQGSNLALLGALSALLACSLLYLLAWLFLV